MNKAKWVYISGKGKRNIIGVLHSPRLGHFIIYCDKKIILAERKVFKPTSFSFFIDDELCIISTNIINGKFKYQIQFDTQTETPLNKVRKKINKKNIRYSLLAFLGLFIGAKLTVVSIEEIGYILKIPAAFLTLTTVSVATSLPELAVTISSTRKKEYLIAIGNIIGTNVMNVCIIIGMSGFLGNYAVETSLFVRAVIFSFIATTLMSYLVLKRKFSPKWGYIFVGLYVLFLISTFL